MATKKRPAIHGGSVDGALKNSLSSSSVPLGRCALPIVLPMHCRFTC